MSIQSSSTTTKSAIVAATMLAIEAEGHGILNGHWGAEAFNDDTPISRGMKFMTGDASVAYPGSHGLLEQPYINGAENRMDGGLTPCDVNGGPGWKTKAPFDDRFEAGTCYPASEICPAVWYNTVADSDTSLGDDENWFGCPYDGENYAADDRYATGCCGGFQYMSKTPDSGDTNTLYEITTGGEIDPTTGWYEGGEATGKMTSCWAHNGDVPGGDKTKDYWRNDSNFKAEKEWTMGQEVDLSWISTANHGGMYEYGIVCDGDETYENFTKPEHRLTFLKGRETSGFYQGIGGLDAGAKRTQPMGWARLDKTVEGQYKSVNGGKEILSNEENPRWAFCPAPSSPALPADATDAEKKAWNDEVKNRSTMTENNFTMRNVLKLPDNIHGEKCTLGWFWWGMVSKGTFVACADITINKPTLRNGSSTQDNL